MQTAWVKKKRISSKYTKVMSNKDW